MDQSMNDYEVVRQDFIASQDEPQLTFNQGRMYVNNYCVKQFPDDDYIQILVDRMNKAFVIKPLKEKVKDSIRWCGMTEKRKARHMRCIPLYYLTYKMMKWDINSRYKITGHIETDGEGASAIYFGLKDARCFVPVRRDEKSGRIIYKQHMPEEWNMTFGVKLQDYQDGQYILRHEEDGVFEIELPLYTEKLEKNSEDNNAKGEVIDGTVD